MAANKKPGSPSKEGARAESIGWKFLIGPGALASMVALQDAPVKANRSSCKAARLT
jgi:hypothetical protein